jgi:DNA-binding CsgD family transcriptional regulator/pimeloyl-ACP methyl ester carboxylesterase
MPSPEIRYVSTRDGARIAFHAIGAGPAIVMLFPYHVNHLSLNWAVPLHRGAMTFLGRYFTVVNLDLRGAGLSDGGATEPSLDAFAEDIRAVLAALDVQHVAFCAIGAGSLVASQFALQAANQVAGLVFVQAGDSPANMALLKLRRRHPGVEAQVRGALLSGVDRSNASALAAVAREALGPRALARWESMLRRIDLTALASDLHLPVLCVHATDDELVTRAAMRRLLKRIPHATLTAVAGKSGMDVWRDRTAMRTMASFLTTAFERRDVAPRRVPRSRRSQASSNPAGLSAREVDVLRALALGKKNQEIAVELFLSPHTVSYHLRNIYAKAGVANRAEAAAFAHRHGLVG